MKHLALFVVPALLCFGCDRASDTHAAAKHDTPAATKPAPAPTTAPAKSPNVPANNTAKNERDRDGDTLTPIDQAENPTDIAITKAIRQGVLDMPSPSVAAKNIKIVTVDGVVTLRGPVATEAEKTAVEALAKKAPGVTRVDNQLEIEAH